MNKTTTIHIQGTVFTLEEEAYTTLKQYLDDIAAHFADSPDKQDIVNDIEQSIAEKWMSKTGAAQNVITLADVNEMISVLGRVEDFDAEEGVHNTAAESKSSEQKTAKRLYRNMDNAMIAGVASGIATYFAIDPVIIRIAFVALTLFGGSGILIYLILWLIMPEAKTAVQKSEMHGTPITLQNIAEQAQSMINKGINTGKETWSKKKGSLTPVGNRISAGVRRITSAIGSIIGVCFIAMASLGLMGLVFLCMSAIFNHDMWPVEPSVQEIASVGEVTALSIAAFFFVIIPLLTVLLLGIRLIRKRAVFTVGLIVTFALLWGAALSTGGALLTSIVPRIEAYQERTNPVITKTVDVFTEFSTVTAANDVTVKLVPGDTTSVVVTGPQRAVDVTTITQEGAELNIARTDFFSEENWMCLWCDIGEVEITITSPSITRVKLSDIAQLEIENAVIDTLEIHASDASRIDTDDVTLNQLTMVLNDIAYARMEGTATTAIITTNDSSNFYGDNFETTNATVNTNDVSHVRIEVTETLNGSVNDVSSLRYFGDPSVTVNKKSRNATVKPL